MSTAFPLRRFLPALVTVALVATLGLLAPAQAGTTPASTAVARAGGGAYSASVVKWTNRKRAKHDRRKLKTKKCLTKAAHKWAVHMADNGSLVHQNDRAVMRRCNLRSYGENIAYGFSSGKAVVRAWMHSPGHRRNILDRSYRLIGVGAAKDDNGVWWVSQVFGRR